MTQPSHFPSQQQVGLCFCNVLTFYLKKQDMEKNITNGFYKVQIDVGFFAD